MPVTLQSAVRRNASPCDHFLVTLVAEAGRTVTVEMTLAEVTGAPITDEEIRATLKVWARYHRAKGVAFNTLVGKAVFGDIP